MDLPLDVTVGDILKPLLIINKNTKYMAKSTQLKNNKLSTTNIK